jgi:hypothetical protein
MKARCKARISPSRLMRLQKELSRVLVGTQNDGGAGQDNGLSWTAMISAAGQSEATVSLSRLMRLQKELRPSFNRELGTMVERCVVVRGDRRRNAAERSFALRDAGLIVTSGRWLSVNWRYITGDSKAWCGCAQLCIAQLCTGTYTFRMPSSSNL